VTAADDEWELRLLPRDQAAGSAPVQVFLTEQALRVVDGRHWVHQTTYWLYHEGSTDLRVTLPGGAAVLGAAVDGSEVIPLPADPDGASLWLPLPGGSGARQVCLRWAFDGPEREGLDRPDLDRPRLAGVLDGPVIWSVHVPAGYGPGPAGEGAARPANRAAIELWRAEAQRRLSAVLVQKAHGQGNAFAAQLAAAQRRFYQSWRRAEHWLDTAGARAPLLESAALWGETDRTAAARTSADGVGPAGQALADWLHQLDDEDAQLVRGSPELEAVRAGARHQARAGAGGSAAPPPTSEEGCAEDIDDRGTPLYWQAKDPATPAPSLALTSTGVRQARRALAASLLLMAVLLVAWVLSGLPGVLPRLRALWPEQTALLGAVAWLLFGLTPVSAGLLLLGLTGRLVLLARQYWAWLGREAPSPAGGPVSG
jgi:hypothetical protein